MRTVLVVEDTGFGLRAARQEDGRLVEVIDVDHDPNRVTDRLFAARVTRIEPKFGAAFLDIGLAENGFLNAKDARHMPGADPRAPIDRILTEGQRLVVMGLREAGDEKGPRVTCDVRLIGVNLILRPSSEIVEVSGNLGKRQQAELLERAEPLFPQGGVLLRRGALERSDEELLAEHAGLRSRWHEFLDRAKKGVGPLGSEDTVERMFRTLLGNPVDAIMVADLALAARVREFAIGHLGDAAPAVELVEGDLFEVTGIQDELDQALQREVALPGGGRIWIERTAALTAIDVDAGGNPPMPVNLAAANEIARQLRLRNIGGIVVVDFIDLSGRNERNRVVEVLKKALARDPVPAHVHDVSPQGLIEIGRPKRGISLGELLQRPCPVCRGEGHAPSLRAQAEALLRALRRASPAARVRAAGDLARHLRARPAQEALARLGHAGRIEADQGLQPGTFVIE